MSATQPTTPAVFYLEPLEPLKPTKVPTKPRCVGCGKFIGKSNMQDTMHCTSCWSSEDDLLY